jgi:hypothetical protein
MRGDIAASIRDRDLTPDSKSGPGPPPGLNKRPPYDFLPAVTEEGDLRSDPSRYVAGLIPTPIPMPKLGSAQGPPSVHVGNADQVGLTAIAGAHELLALPSAPRGEDALNLVCG